MGHGPGDTSRRENVSRIFNATNQSRQSTNSIKINCHRKLKCIASITWPLLTSIGAVISLMRKLHWKCFLSPHFAVFTFHFLLSFARAWVDWILGLIYSYMYRVYLVEWLLSIWWWCERRPAHRLARAHTHTHTRMPYPVRFDKKTHFYLSCDFE